jgi:[ribosomal protein S5]-alanine N-acetyltransferase
METMLETARLLLNQPTPGDIDAMFRILSDRRTTRFNPSDALQWNEEADGLFQRWEAQWENHGVGYFAVRLPGREEPIGFAGVKHVSLSGRPVLNLYFRFDPAVWHRGYGREAVGAVVAHVNEFLELPPVLALVHPDNTASIRIVTSLGFERNAAAAISGPDGYQDAYVLNWDRQL